MSSCKPHRTRTYSNDIRWKIVWLRAAKEYSCRKIASQLCIGYGTVIRTLKMFELSGDVAKRPPSSRPYLRVLDDYHKYFVIGIVMDNPTIHLDELCRTVSRATGVQVSVPTVCRLLKR